jgi:glycosyltransferase involved in cell wall biosynthesis
MASRSIALETPSLSIVTVCLNSAATIGDTLESVNRQTHPAIEHIVVDGGSTDGTQRIVETQGRRVARLVSERDRGIYDAMNKGLALATGDVIGFLNADDTFAGLDSAAHIAAAFRPEVDVCYGDLLYVGARDPSKVIRYWRSQPYRIGLCAGGWAPPHPTLYVRREVLRKVGGFDADMRVAADFEMALRLLDVHRLAPVYLPEVLVHMRVGGVSNRSLKGVLRGHRELASALRRHGFPSGWTWSARRLLARVPQFFMRPGTGTSR